MVNFVVRNNEESLWGWPEAQFFRKEALTMVLTIGA